MFSLTNESIMEEAIKPCLASIEKGIVPSDMQSSMIFAAALLSRTKKINACLSVLPLPHYNIKLLIKQLEDLGLPCHHLPIPLFATQIHKQLSRRRCPPHCWIALAVEMH